MRLRREKEHPGWQGQTDPERVKMSQGLGSFDLVDHVDQWMRTGRHLVRLTLVGYTVECPFSILVIRGYCITITNMNHVKI